jgi:integrase
MTAKKEKLPEGVRRLKRPGDTKKSGPTGRYQARYAITRGDKRVYVSVGTFASKEDAKQARTTALAAYLAKVNWVDPEHKKLTVGQWAEMWWGLRPDERRQPKVRSCINSQIKGGRWENVRLEDVTLADVQAWVNQMAKRYQPATTRDYYGIFCRIMDAAVTHEKVARQRWHLERGSLPKQVKTVAVYLTPEQGQTLEDVAPDRHKMLVHLALWTGLRWGETAALLWEQIDLEAGLLTVSRAAKRDGTIGLPKNGKTRVIEIDALMVARLRAHRRDFGDHDLVFTTETGAPLEYNNMRRDVWLPMVRAAELDPAPTWHDLRHTYASRMVELGLDWLVLSSLMGHHHPSFTMDRYGSLRHDREDVVRDALRRAREKA